MKREFSLPYSFLRNLCHLWLNSSRPPGVWYLGRMVTRALAVLLFLAAGRLGCHGDEVVTNILGRVIHTLGGRSTIRDVMLSSNTYPGFMPGSVRANLWLSNYFAGFVPGTLADVVWRGFQTNGRSTKIWECFEIPAGGPAKPPVLRWNTNNLMWGRKGMTAISQAWEGPGTPSQFAITALTRRHGYLLGHAMGARGFDPKRVGKRVWFCTRDNQVIERKVQLFFVAGPDTTAVHDYSIALFDADLPPAIEPMRVVDPEKVRQKYLFLPMDRKPVLMALQGGYVSAGILDWDIPVRGGDSGGPRMLPLPDELVFLEGITCSPPSPAMQADMDMLSRKAGLEPGKYQMQWVNLDGYANP